MTSDLLTSVGLLDLRNWSGGEPPAMVGRVIVLDDAATLLDHWELYLSLVSDRQVTGVVCVAIGESANAAKGNGVTDPVILRIPGVLPNGGGAVLWVGDVQGVVWGAARDQPRPAGPGRRTSLDQLLLALRVPEVFDVVRNQVRELRGRAANPGFVLFSGAIESTELGEARASAIKELTTAWPDRPAPKEFRESIARLGAVPRQPASAALKSPVDATEANRRLDQAEELARALRFPRLLTGSDRPGLWLVPAVAGAGQAVEQYHNALSELLHRIDGQLRRGDTSVAQVVEMGVQEPDPVRPPSVAEGLCAAVHTQLTQDSSLSRLSVHLRREATIRQPQGCSNALAQLRGIGPLQRAVTASRRWPIPLTALVLVALTCFTTAFVAPAGVLAPVVGAAFVLGWLLPSWLLLARWPRPGGERGLGGAALPALGTYGLVGLGSATGGLVTARLGGSVELPTSIWQAVIAVAAVVVVATVVLSWQASARRLANGLKLPALRAAITDMTVLAESVVAGEWQPSERNRVVARALNEAADGLLEIAETLQRAGMEHSDSVDDTEAAMPGGILRALPPELLTVVRNDLLGLSRTALTPAWQATAVGRRTDAGTYAQRTQRLLTEYDAHVERTGLMSRPTTETDLDSRPQLLARVWSESPEAREALRIRGADDMIQLCSGRQLGDLSTSDEPIVIRFAPESVRPVLESDRSHHSGGIQDLRVVWTANAELGGALRLLPLQSATISTEQGGGRL